MRSKVKSRAGRTTNQPRNGTLDALCTYSQNGSGTINWGNFGRWGGLPLRFGKTTKKFQSLTFGC